MAVLFNKKIQENKEEKENNLITAALKLFTEKGVKETSVQEITNEAGVAKGTFYLYFKDKYECDIVHGTGMTRCGRNDPDAIYAIYNSLETSSLYDFEAEEIVPMSKVNEFENNHVILISSKSICFEKEEFWMDIINLGYEKACERLVEKSKKYFD